MGSPIGDNTATFFADSNPRSRFRKVRISGREVAKLNLRIELASLTPSGHCDHAYCKRQSKEMGAARAMIFSGLRGRSSRLSPTSLPSRSPAN